MCSLERRGGASGRLGALGIVVSVTMCKVGTRKRVKYSSLVMADGSEEDNEEQQHANIAAWIASQHAAAQAELARSDLLPWVVENQLYMPDLARGSELNVQAPWTYPNFRTYVGQSRTENDPDMHRTNQMADTDLYGYMVENSFIVRKMPVGESTQNRWAFRLVAVKILCKRAAIVVKDVADTEGRSSVRNVWSAYSYSNHWDDAAGHGRRLWVHYPTGETSRIIDYDTDTRANHRRAVEATMTAGDPIDFMICVMCAGEGRNAVVQHVFSKARVVDAWRETHDGTKTAAMYQIEVCPEAYAAAA